MVLRTEATGSMQPACDLSSRRPREARELGVVGARSRSVLVVRGLDSADLVRGARLTAEHSRRLGRVSLEGEAVSAGFRGALSFHAS